MRQFPSWIALSVAALACTWIVLRQPVAAQNPASTARNIQQTLDSTGFCQLGAGTYNIDTPIRLKAGQRMVGVGFATKLVYTGVSPWAVVFGEREKPNYGCYLDDILISGGGLLCESFGQHCAVERVWVTKSRGDGVRIEGLGERLILRDVISWENAVDGFSLRTGDTINGIVFDHCNAQNNGGYGFRLETLTANSELVGTVIRDATIQANGKSGSVTAEVLIQGYVNVTRIENVWIENEPRFSPSVSTGIRSIAVAFPNAGGEPVVRRPNRLAIDGASVISLLPRAMEVIDCYDCAIEQLWVSPASAKVYWKSDKTGPEAGGLNRLRGEKWMLGADQLVADPGLR